MTRTYAVGNLNTILRQDDLTGPWIDISPSTGINNWYDVMAVPGQPDIVMAVGTVTGNGSTARGIVVSNDAGVTWSIPSGNWANTTKIFRELWIVDINTIWIVGDGGAVVKSTDGGLNFNNPNIGSNTSKPGQGQFPFTTAIHALDANVAVVGGSPFFGSGSNECYVWKTIDGGNSWLTLNQSSVYTTPTVPSLRNTQIPNHVGSITLQLQGTFYPWGAHNNVQTSTNGSGTGLTVDFTANGGLVQTVSVNNPGQNYQTGDIITILDGNNNATAVVTATLTGNKTGGADGIWISDDQQKIIVGTNYTQQLSIDGGSTFNAVAPEVPASGYHLTWFPSHTLPTNFRHTGQINQVVQTTNVGNTWSLARTGVGTIVAAHFYSTLNGYYTIAGSIFNTTDGGVTGTQVYNDLTSGFGFQALWTETALNTPCWLFLPCDNTLPSIVWHGAILAQWENQLIRVESTVGNTTVLQCGVIVNSNDPDICSQAQEFDPLVYNIETGFRSCDECALTDIIPCYNLISCRPDTCPDIHYATDEAFSQYIGQYVEINGSTNCRYLVQSTRQAYFYSLSPAALSNPAGNFQLGSDDFTLELVSIVINGTEYLSTPATPYILTPSNYSVVECNQLVCAQVPVNTTENCIENIPSYINNVFVNNNIFDLTALCSDPVYCNGAPLFKIQYPEGTTFTITLNITSPFSGALQLILYVNAGNVTGMDYAALSGDNQSITSLDTCNSNIQCSGNYILNRDIPQIVPFTECLPLVQPEIGAPCPITPRLGEPGFSSKNCDPKKIIDIKCKFGDAVYAEYKKMVYGIETCCEFDLDKIEIKNSLIDFGFIYDPDLCVEGEPVPYGCCPQPCSVEAVLEVPMYQSCPIPSNVVVEIDVPVIPPAPCDAPIDANVSIVIPLPNCVSYGVTIPLSSPAGTIEYTDCNGIIQTINYPSVIAPLTEDLIYDFCADPFEPITTTGIIADNGVCENECFSTLWDVQIPAAAGFSSWQYTDCNGITLVGIVQPAGLSRQVCGSSLVVPSSTRPGIVVTNLGRCS